MAPNNNEISALHPNNPASPRYWKNIIPESQLIETRAGIGVLPAISDSIDKLDIILGFGNEYDGNFSIGGETYSGYIEIYITLYDAIKEIQFKLSGIDLPNISDIGDENFGGIVGSDPNFSTVSIINNVVIINGNLIGQEFPDGTACYVEGCINELLLKIPFISKGVDICFLPYISDNYYVSIIDENDDIYINPEDFGYWNTQTGGPLVNLCYLPFSDIIINIESPQTWLGVNEYGNNYYYPVLPKINVSGEFDEELCLQNGTMISGGEYCHQENIPFGGFRNWNEDDLYAAITLTTLPDYYLDFCLVDLDFSQIEDGTLSDSGPVTNFGVLVDDYKVNFDSKTNEPSSKKLITKSRLDKRVKGKSF
jgi:hypothetical protein